jgi:hypothetical protein
VHFRDSEAFRSEIMDLRRYSKNSQGNSSVVLDVYEILHFSGLASLHFEEEYRNNSFAAGRRS